MKRRSYNIIMHNPLVFGITTSILLTASVHAGSEQSLSELMKSDKKSSVDASSPYTRVLDFEKFKQSVYREPFEGGGYIVNGDVFIPNDTYLLEFYVRNLVAESQSPDSGMQVKFIVDKVDGYENIWSSDQKGSITYCVSKSFGTSYDRVVTAMQMATLPWESSANINFIHLPSEDSACDQTNTKVLFDVRPVSVNGQYLARAFFPNYNRSQRNVMIDASALQYSNEGLGLTLTGILRHELGHTVGARHEHTRPQSGKCFEDKSWTPVTDYDAFSVMHYPQCNGLGDWTLNLTKMDANGVACTYGAASGFVVDQSICKPKAYKNFEVFSSI